MRLNIPSADAQLDKYYPVLDHGFVALKDYMGGDKSVEQFARTSYHIGDEVRELKDTRNLLRYLVRNLHTSPLESCELVFHIGLPIFVARQLIRHRAASLNEFSGRYSELPTIFYTPDNNQVCFQSGTNKQGSGQPVDENIFEDFTSNNRIDRRGVVECYKWALEQGISRETARIDLPLSTYTYMYWKMDLHNLMHFIGLRSDSHAQWEIQQYSDVFAALMKSVAPLCYEAFIDYKFGSERFSRMEMGVLRTLVSDTVNDTTLKKLLLEQGVDGKREQQEFVDKLKFKALKSFDLDYEVAKDAQFFFDKVKANL